MISWKKTIYFLLVFGGVFFIFFIYNPDSNEPMHVLKTKGDIDAVKFVFNKSLSEDDRKSSDLVELMELIHKRLNSPYFDYYGNRYILKETDGIIYFGTYGLDNASGGEGESVDYFAPLNEH